MNRPDANSPGVENWRNYPIFAELITDQARYQEMRDRCLGRCRLLDQTLEAGTAEQRDVAQQTLNAIGYALAILDEAVQKRDEIVQQEEAGGLR